MDCHHCEKNMAIDQLFYCKNCNQITCQRCAVKYHMDSTKHELDDVADECLPALADCLVDDVEFFETHDPKIRLVLSNMDGIENQINSVTEAKNTYRETIVDSRRSELEKRINQGTLTFEDYEYYKKLSRTNKAALLTAAKQFNENSKPLLDSVTALNDKVQDLQLSFARAEILKKSLGIGAQETIVLVGGCNKASAFIDTMIFLQPQRDGKMKSFQLRNMTLTAPRRYHQSCFSNGDIITFGGLNSTGSYLNSAESIELKTQTKSNLSNMACSRSLFASTVIGNQIYACGGSNSAGALNLCESYDLATTQWQAINPMQYARYGCSGTSLDKIIYVTGGYSNESLPLVESYDPSVGVWITRPPLKTGRYFHGAAVLNRMVWVCGGASCANRCEGYDPRINQWVKCADMKEGRYAMALANADDKLYAIGGFGKDGALGSMERYDIRQNKWELLGDTIEPLYDMSACVI